MSKEAKMRRGYDPEFVKFIRRAKIAGAVFALAWGAVVGYGWHEFGNQSDALERQVTRIDDLTMRVHDTSCASADTLRRLIGTQRVNRAAFRRLGFSDAQIAGVAKDVQKAKDRNLALLGERDPTCPPVKEP